jgi:Leucine-rich repeat (LRR) protein
MTIGYQEAVDRIELAVQENATELDLSELRLNALPPEINQLTNLTSLNLSNNQLSALPLEIVQLASLTKLNLRNNQLSVLLPEIGQLTNLTSLNLGINQLSALPPEIVQLVNLGFLNLALPEFAGLQVNPRFYPTNCADCAGQISDSPTKPPLKHEVCIDRLFTPRIPGEP